MHTKNVTAVDEFTFYPVHRVSISTFSHRDPGRIVEICCI